MKTIELLFCGKEEQRWEEYLLFLLRRYDELGLPYDHEMTLSFIGSPYLGSDALLAQLKGTGETIGALGFVFGTGEDFFDNDSICQVEIIYIDKQWRHTKLFGSMLVTFAKYLEQQHPAASLIQFWSPADRQDLNKLFAKFSDLIKTNDKSFGRVSLYQTNTKRILLSTAGFAKISWR